MNRYYARLSWSHPSLAISELRAILEVESGSHRIESVFDGIAVFSADIEDPAIITWRAGMVKEVGLLLGVCEQDPSSIVSVIDSHKGLIGSEPLRVDVRVFKRLPGHPSGSRVERGIVESLKGYRLSPRARRTLMVLLTEGVSVVGLVLYRQDKKPLVERSPGRRPFFKPGPLTADVSRAMVNLSRMRRGSVFLDPFCGTGGFGIEACLMGARLVICGDLDWEMSVGGSLNLSVYCGRGGHLYYLGDAAMIPLAPGVVDALATDPPYGRSTSTKQRRYTELVEAFLGGAVEVVKRGSRIVYAGPASLRPWTIAESLGLRVAERIHMYVHSTLTREIVVAVA